MSADTLSRKTPPELLTRKTAVEFPHIIKYFAKDKTSPRLERIESGSEQKRI